MRIAAPGGAWCPRRGARPADCATSWHARLRRAGERTAVAGAPHFLFGAFAAGRPRHQPRRPRLVVGAAPARLVCARRALQAGPQARTGLQLPHAVTMVEFGHGPPDAYGCPLPPLGIEASSARQVRHACVRARRCMGPVRRAEPQLTCAAATALRGARHQARRQAGVAGARARRRDRHGARHAPRAACCARPLITTARPPLPAL